MRSDGFYLRNQECSYRYDNDTIIVHKNGDTAKLNPLYAEVVEKCNGENRLIEIEEEIFKKYEIKEDDTEARQLFNTVIEELLEHNIITKISESTPTHCRVNSITGKKGKSFPQSLMLELTNSCNFCCKHCFKDAKVTSAEYINVSDFEHFLSMLSAPFELIEITGGECTLHPRINDIIEIAAKAANKVTLLSNGSNIQAINSDNLSLLNKVQISIYGYDKESYKAFTSNEHGFDAVKTGLEILKSHGCALDIAIPITKDNYAKLNNYIEFASRFNPGEIIFAFVLPLGRASKSEYHENWELSSGELLKVRNIINDWADRLAPGINVRKIGDLLSEEADDTSTLKCNAGKSRIIISENGVVRPCVYLPEDIFSMGTMSQYADDILGGKVFDFTNGVSEFKKRLLTKGFTVANMQCVGFCKSVTSDC